jgi:hypothetical protein
VYTLAAHLILSGRVDKLGESGIDAALQAALDRHPDVDCRYIPEARRAFDDGLLMAEQTWPIASKSYVDGESRRPMTTVDPRSSSLTTDVVRPCWAKVPAASCAWNSLVSISR